MRLLIIGTLKGQLTIATRMAMDQGANVIHAENREIALRVLRAGRGADLLMVDVEEDIGALIQQLTTERIHVPVIACGVGNNAHAAMNAIRTGAREYIPLPPDSEMIAAVLTAVSDDTHEMIYRDQNMALLIQMAEKIAPSNASILITGESGTGKEVVAHHVHRKSKRAGKPFISLNCAAIPETLLESELFGHEKGAFTGAISRRIGKFEEADQGTILLDEISEMDLRLQAKLLRAIQERVIDRVGGRQPVSIDIRIISTSNRNLEEMSRDGTFRQDLLYRLNVVNLQIPPLRQRPGDIIRLANHFVQKYSKLNDLPLRSFSKAMRNWLVANPWPGNVRELENTIHRAVLLSKTDEIDIETSSTPEDIKRNKTATQILKQENQESINSKETTLHLVGQTVARVERDLILNTLHHCLGNRTHTATILGISIRTLRNKLKQYSDEKMEIPTCSNQGQQKNPDQTYKNTTGNQALEKQGSRVYG
ncbi:MAG: sigma-54 dependent transcriptional regulator [Alphaproteobacteria bacterium]|nr:sigma-54 dependent transcriptional regulator [Alphaproteobacteria bacterium]